VYYEVCILDKGIGRFGWSTVAANLTLGTDGYGMGFGGTGMKSHAGSFEKYG
jgi:ATP-dependent RNA helicase DDX1